MSVVTKQPVRPLYDHFEGLDPFCAQEPFSKQASAQSCSVASRSCRPRLSGDGVACLKQLGTVLNFHQKHSSVSHLVLVGRTVEHRLCVCWGGGRGRPALLSASILRSLLYQRRGARGVCGAVAKRLRHSAVSAPPCSHKRGETIATRA